LALCVLSMIILAIPAVLALGRNRYGLAPRSLTDKIGS